MIVSTKISKPVAGDGLAVTIFSMALIVKTAMTRTFRVQLQPRGACQPHILIANTPLILLCFCFRMLACIHSLCSSCHSLNVDSGCLWGLSSCFRLSSHFCLPAVEGGTSIICRLSSGRNISFSLRAMMMMLAVEREDGNPRLSVTRGQSESANIEVDLVFPLPLSVDTEGGLELLGLVVFFDCT